MMSSRERNQHSKTSGDHEFKCSSCDEIFTTKQSQLAHEKICEKLTECDKCKLTFKSSVKMRLHQARCRKYQCGMCPVQLDTRTKWLRHKQSHKTHKQFKCQYCDKAFTDKKYFEGHIISHESGKRPFKCYMCTSTFITLANKLQHEKSHQGVKPYQCQMCGVAFTAKSKLSRHEQSHESYKQYKCVYCEKTFSDKRYFAAHEKMHESGERPYKCSKCPSSFIVRNHLTQHEKAHSTLRLFQCEQCLASFPTNARLKRHINGHLNFKKFQCTHCMKSFSDLKYLAAHEKVHEIDTPTDSSEEKNDINDTADLTAPGTNQKRQELKCRHCSKVFHNQSYLNAHEKSHSGARPYKCDLCDSAYMMRSHLTAHVKLHTNEKAFICDGCGKAFPTNARLKRHMKSRVEGRECRKYGPVSERKRDASSSKFACDICEKSFASKAVLSKHCKSHMKHEDIQNDLESSGVDLRCECGTSFKTKELFKSHVLSTHPSESDPSAKSCPECKCHFKSPKLLHKHIKKYHALHPCSVCSGIYKTADELSRHYIESKHGGDTKTKCPLCDEETFIDHKEIADHLRDQHGNQKRYVCAVCGEGYWGKDVIKTHINDKHSSIARRGSSLIIKCKIGALHVGFSTNSNRSDTINKKSSSSDSSSSMDNEALGNDSNDERASGTFDGVNKKDKDVVEGSFMPFTPLLDDNAIPTETKKKSVEEFNKVIENQVQCLETILKDPKSKQYALGEEGSEAVIKCLDTLGGQKVIDEQIMTDEQGDYACELCGMNFMHKRSWVMHNRYQHNDGQVDLDST